MLVGRLIGVSHVTSAFVWSFVILAVFAPIAVARYRRATAR